MTQVYKAIAELEDEGFSVSALCHALTVTRSAHYRWLNGESGLRGQDDEQLRVIVRSIFWEHNRRYGARRIVKELAVRQLRDTWRRILGAPVSGSLTWRLSQ